MLVVSKQDIQHYLGILGHSGIRTIFEMHKIVGEIKTSGVHLVRLCCPKNTCPGLVRSFLGVPLAQTWRAYILEGTLFKSIN